MKKVERKVNEYKGFGEDPKSLGREEYLGKNKRKTGLGAGNYRKHDVSEKENKSDEDKKSTRSDKNYLQEVYTSGDARTDQDYMKKDFRGGEPLYGEDYSDELYG